jgi:hypothetical protein
MKKVVYLFGAGATHAEIINIVDDPNASYRDKNGLLISNLSKRVMQAARKTKWFKQKEEIFTSSKGSLNIELLISLFENNQIEQKYVKKLKELVETDIKRILTEELKNKFYLHKGLLELHKIISDQEELLALISLNYDDVLDLAYKEIYKLEPNYCLTSQKNNHFNHESFPLLKLHGSFTWENIEVYDKLKSIPIIPLGINKNYLLPPYNFIWGEAFEVLIKCDTLRILGCSLNQSDIGLIDLLFKAHLERDKQISLEIIDFQPQNSHHPIKTSYGFFPGIIEPKDIEGTLIADESISKCEVGNPFKIWLQAKGKKMLDEKVYDTEYLKKCF